MFDTAPSRRRFIKSGVAVGMAGGVAGQLTKDTKDVRYVAAYSHTNHDAVARGDEPPKREPIYETMPLTRWLDIMAARKAERRLNRRILQHEDTTLIRAGKRWESGEPRLEVRHFSVEDPHGDRIIPQNSPFEVEDLLPSTERVSVEFRGERMTRDIPVHVSVQDRKLHCPNTGYYDYNYRPVPGGCEFISDGDCNASLCTPAWDSGLGEYVMVTAGHAIDQVTSGKDCWQPASQTSSNYIGFSSNADYKTTSDTDNHDPDDRTFDAATIRMTDAGVAYELANDSGGYYSGVNGISGCLSWTEIENDDAIDRTYQRQGARTGRVSGSMDWTSDYYKIFETLAEGDSGDSGGPHFKEKNGYAYIAGVHNWGDDTYAGATAMEAVENEFGISC